VKLTSRRHQGSSACSLRLSGCLQDAPTKQIEKRLSVHVPFQQLELVHLSFHMPVAPAAP
jgi:hypothetical protein